jgi:quinol monooxygenase YgiN
MSSFSYVWEFIVNPEHLGAFEAAYGPDGEWVKLFGQDPDYIRTDLHRDVRNQHRFICVDHWKTQQACMSFRERYRKQYDALDKQFQQYTVDERQLGNFDLLG